MTKLSELTGDGPHKPGALLRYRDGMYFHYSWLGDHPSALDNLEIFWYRGSLRGGGSIAVSDRSIFLLLGYSEKNNPVVIWHDQVIVLWERSSYLEEVTES